MQEASPLANSRETAALPARAVSAIAAVLMLCGLALRIWFLRRHAFWANDSLLYQDIALNWLHAHIYGLSTGPVPRPTLIRLPGYPAILAACAWVFDRFMGNPQPGTAGSFLPVLWLQIIADMATCWLVATTARRLFGDRGFLAALALACLCPFTANYAVTPLTETFTLFFLALAFHTLQRWLHAPTTGKLMLIATALACSVMLRPDQGLLAAAILPAIYFKGRWRPLLLCAVLAAVPFVPWTARNAHVFGVFQPLAPKQATDPGEAAPLGFERWFRTWGVDFSASEDAYWNYPDDPINVDDLPVRAFDSPAERAETKALLEHAGFLGKLDPATEAHFADLAERRIHAHPVRYYVVLPVARLANMLLHPRTEMLNSPERWWQYRLHPAKTIYALLYALWSFAYFAMAIAGWPQTQRANRTLAWSMAAYVLLRCALLLTLDNTEQRYTLEFFPIAIVFASALLQDAGAKAPYIDAGDSAG